MFHSIPCVVWTQTNMPDFEHTQYEVHRSETDFDWLLQALEESCPERVTPKLISHTSLNGKKISKPFLLGNIDVM